MLTEDEKRLTICTNSSLNYNNNRKFKKLYVASFNFRIKNSTFKL